MGPARAAISGLGLTPAATERSLREHRRSLLAGTGILWGVEAEGVLGFCSYASLWLTLGRFMLRAFLKA